MTASIELTLKDLVALNVSEAVQDLLSDYLISSVKNMLGNDPKKIKAGFINEIVPYYVKAKHTKADTARKELSAMLPAELESWYRNVHMYDYNSITPIGLKDKNGKIQKYMLFTHVDNKLDPAQAISNIAKNFVEKNTVFKEKDPKTGKQVPVGPKFADTRIGMLKSVGEDKNGNPKIMPTTISINPELLKQVEEKAK